MDSRRDQMRATTRARGATGMHDTPPPNVPPEPAPRRSSVVPLASAVGAGQPPSTPPTPGTTDHVPTILGENPFARPVVSAFSLPPGATLGHFEIVGPLGAGGMATVFKAKDLTLGREVALKILPPTLAADPDAVSRFKFEARAAAKLNHDHVARVFFIGEDQGLHFIAFEYVDGRTLRDLIDLDGPISPADAVRFMIDTAIGLQHSAEKGVVHRDVKPSNIIITPAGRAKLIDMGLARSVDPHSRPCAAKDAWNATRMALWKSCKCWTANHSHGVCVASLWSWTMPKSGTMSLR